MIGKLGDVTVAIAALLLISAIALAQEQEPERTLEERVTALEQAVASLDTRFGLRGSADALDGADRGVAILTRVNELERSLNGLRADLERIARQSDTALREASQARRDAMTAQQLARDAMSRSR